MYEVKCHAVIDSVQHLALIDTQKLCIKKRFIANINVKDRVINEVAN